MGTFFYEARHKNGALIKGTMEANDANHVANQLIQDHLIPLDIRASLPRFSWRFTSLSFSRQKVNHGTLMIFCRQMYSLIKAGIPIISIVQRLAEITMNKVLANALKVVSQEIVLGNSLSTAMQRTPTIFSPLLIALVTNAEANGRLDQAFLQATKYYELEDMTRKRVKAALRYPILVILFAFAAVMLINVFVIPKFASLYSSFHTQLPLPTRILISFSQFVHNGWWAILIVIGMMFLLVYFLLQRPEFRMYIDRIKIKLPIVGNMIERIIMANFARNLAMLLQTGVILTKALSLVANVANNSYAKEKILSMLDSIEHGKNLTQAATHTHFFSPLILQMISVGEETGNIDNMLLEVGEFYEREIDYDIKQLTDKIEPILLLIVGAIVLLLAVGVFLPMWNLTYVVR